MKELFEYLAYYFSKEGQANAQYAWDYNAGLMHARHEHETEIANHKWKVRKVQEAVEMELMLNKVFKFFGLKRTSLI